MGRPPKPVELRRATDRIPGKTKADGTPYASQEIAVPANSGQVTEHYTEIPDPVELTGHSFGKRGLMVWNQIFSESGWRLTAEDFFHVEIICQEYDKIDAWNEAIGTKYTVLNYAKVEVANGLISEVRKSQMLIIKCFAELGYGPSQRTRLGFKKVQEADALFDLETKIERHNQGVV